MYNKENLLNHIQKVKPEGFGLLKDSFGYVSSDVEQKVIYLATREYFPHGAYIFGASAHITFNEIENKLKPLYLAQGVKNSDVYTIKNSLVNIEGVDYNLLDQEIDDDNSFARISGELKKLIDAALLFFDKLNTIEDVANFLADKEPKEIVPFIQGTILFPKTILILEFADHPKFEEKRDEFYELLKKQATKRKQTEVDLRVFEKLFIKRDGVAALSW